ncbi:hypothetical protein GCM10027043_51760 [Ferruginibacter profundus]
MVYSFLPHDKSRKNHKWTTKICDNLYSETFCSFGQGAWGGDRDAKWLTDSTNFRIFLGAFDEVDGGIFVECKGDSIFITQRPDDLDVNHDIKYPVTKAYHLKELKKLGNLNDF